MKRKTIILMLALVVAFSATASAKPNQHKKQDHPSFQNEKHDKREKWDHPSYRGEKWRAVRYEKLPFVWHEHRNYIYRPGHRVERIQDYGWSVRFPGLVAYKWHDTRGEGFWYQGRRISDAVMFYNSSDELVSVGFMHNGAFLFIRDDDSGYENHDSFFVSWWH